MRKKRIAIFASGSGTNAERIMEHFRDHQAAEVAIVLSNKPDAKVLERALKFGVPRRVFNRAVFYDSPEIVDLLQEINIDLVVLAGFLWLIPSGLLKAFEGRIVNIHPALLPRYGGKGMYGLKVHEAVIQNKDKESGITIHLVNEEYDRGEHLLQKKCPVYPDDTPETLAERVHRLEYEYYPRVIEDFVRKTFENT